MKMKHTLWELEVICRGAKSTNADYRCDINTLRYVADGIFSTEDSTILLDDFTRMSAYRYMTEVSSSPFRLNEVNLMPINLLTFQSRVCAGANELISAEAEGRRERNETILEEDYVCKDNNYSFMKLSPFNLYGVDGDHANANTKKCNPANLRNKNIFKRLDEICQVAFTCGFCHSIRTWHQNRAPKNWIPKCFYTIGRQIIPSRRR